MSFGLVIEADVREEMRKAGDWYESREPGVGGRFAVVLDKYLQQVVSNPFRYPKARGRRRTRQKSSAGLTRSIYFTILEKQALGENCRRLARKTKTPPNCAGD